MNPAQAPAVTLFVVSVKFNNLVDKTYDYRTDILFQPGDSAVVEANGALKCVDVVGVYEGVFLPTKIPVNNLKWVVARVDTGPYLARMAEVAAVERELAEIMEEADRRRVVQEVKFALNDPDLVARYDSVLARQQAL